MHVKKKKLELKKMTLRRLSKRDLEEVAGGTLFAGFTLSGCGGYCLTDVQCPPIEA